jgi:excisionase family DNA binding protein
MDSCGPNCKWLTACELSARLGLPKPYIYRLIREKELPAIRIGRYWRVCEHDLAKWVEDHRLK